MNLTFFGNDRNNWNYNEFINSPNADPYNKKRVINISGNDSYNFIKYNCVIMLKESLKHTIKYLNDDDIDWINKKALQGSKNDYWEILSIRVLRQIYFIIIYLEQKRQLIIKKIVDGSVKTHYI